MSELLLWMATATVFVVAGMAAGWHLGRAREMKRVSRRVSTVLAQVERRHRKELDRFQQSFAKQARELKEVRAKQRLLDAAGSLAQAHQKQQPPEHGFAATQPMQHANH